MLTLLCLFPPHLFSRDILYRDGQPLNTYPLHTRQQMLRQAVRDAPPDGDLAAAEVWGSTCTALLALRRPAGVSACNQHAAVPRPPSHAGYPLGERGIVRGRVLLLLPGMPLFGDMPAPKICSTVQEVQEALHGAMARVSHVAGAGRHLRGASALVGGDIQHFPDTCTTNFLCAA